MENSLSSINVFRMLGIKSTAPGSTQPSSDCSSAITSHIALSKLLHISGFSFFICKMEIIIISTALGCTEGGISLCTCKTCMQVKKKQFEPNGVQQSNRLVQNWERSMSRLYTVTLLI